jgi:hypothetical protein
MFIDFLFIQLFRSIISKLFHKGFLELITIKLAIFVRYIGSVFHKMIKKYFKIWFQFGIEFPNVQSNYAVLN